MHACMQGVSRVRGVVSEASHVVGKQLIMVVTIVSSSWANRLSFKPQLHRKH